MHINMENGSASVTKIRIIFYGVWAETVSRSISEWIIVLYGEKWQRDLQKGSPERICIIIGKIRRGKN